MSQPLRILLNGEPRELASACVLAELVAGLGLAGRRFAVERNGEIVPRSLHDRTQLADGDRVEIVHAIGGG